MPSRPIRVRAEEILRRSEQRRAGTIHQPPRRSAKISGAPTLLSEHDDMFAIDTETTGLDLRHGSKPFFVTVCHDDGRQIYWEWRVDPRTREPEVVEGDVDEIEDLIRGCDGVVMHNAKFDVAALASVRPRIGDEWPWDRTHDTILMGHLVDSCAERDLTSMTLRYLTQDIEPLEVRLKEVARSARVVGRREGWAVASGDLPSMPSLKSSSTMADAWMPREALLAGLTDDESWGTALRDYSNADSGSTMGLWMVLSKEIYRRGLDRIYEERRRILPVLYEMESLGVTVSRENLDRMEREFSGESERLGGVCRAIAESLGYDLTLPRSGRNKSLEEFCFSVLDLPRYRNKKAKTDAPAMDAAAMDRWVEELPERSKASAFVRTLKSSRRYATGATYLSGYRRYALPTDDPGVLVLHPHLNPTATKTLRMGSSDPNEQSISKKEGVNLREAFGPRPGWTWWSLDYQNLELRIPAYESGERDVVEVFDHPDRPPYFGSYHLLVADLLYPDDFREHGIRFKDVFESTKYKWIKNGNFAVVYGAQEDTADRAFHVSGAFEKIKWRFPRMAELSARQVSLASSRGYVETIPDRRVDPDRGYPLRCPTGEWGRISPTLPFNYHVQSTAMQIALGGLVRCHDQIVEWRVGGFWSRVVLQVHDENGFELPTIPDAESFPRVATLKRIMEESGDAVGVPTPVSVTRHRSNWGEGERVDVTKKPRPSVVGVRRTPR